VARSDPQRAQAQLQRDRAVAERDRMRRAHRLRELALERGDFRPLGQPARLQHAGDALELRIAHLRAGQRDLLHARTASPIAATTSSASASVISANMGSESSVAAMRSLTGRLPAPFSSHAYAGWRCTGVG